METTIARTVRMIAVIMNQWETNPGRGSGLADILSSMVLKNPFLLADALIAETNRGVPKRSPKLANSQAPCYPRLWLPGKSCRNCQMHRFPGKWLKPISPQITPFEFSRVRG
jgi:hypothetical protein